MTSPVESSIDSVLAQMRQMRAQASGDIAAKIPSLDAAAATTRESGFGSVLGDALLKVNELQMDAGRRSDAFVSGESSDLVGTMVASQKANLGFQAVVATRNRMVSAYQDIMNMPI